MSAIAAVSAQAQPCFTDFGSKLFSTTSPRQRLRKHVELADNALVVKGQELRIRVSVEIRNGGKF